MSSEDAEMGNNDNFSPELEIQEGTDTIKTYLWPDFAKMQPAQQIRKMLSGHGWYAFFYFAAAVAYWTVFAVKKDTLGISRAIPISLNVITPPVNGTGDAFADAFAVIPRTSLSTLPPTLFFALIASVRLIYHLLHSVVHKDWVRKYLNNKVHPYRWFFQAVVLSLEYSLFFAWNGERELTSFFFLAGAVFACCLAAHALDDAVTRQCNLKGQNSSVESSSSMGTHENVNNYMRALAISASFIIVAFILRLGYNQRVTPNYVFGLSIAVLVHESVAVLYYLYSTSAEKCNVDQHRITFVTGDWAIMLSNFVRFCYVSATVFAMQDKM